MKAYTVILLYPDYLAATFGQDTFMSHCRAQNPATAIRIVQEQAGKKAGIRDGSADEDFYCIACIAGHHNDIKPS